MQLKRNGPWAGAKKTGYKCGKGDFAIFDATPQGNIFLTTAAWNGKVNFPNLMRLCIGLDHSQDGQKVARHTAIHASADISGKIALYIGRAQRPHVRETAAASSRLGSVAPCLFVFNPELDEVSNV